jgi:hypothetical protein
MDRRRIENVGKCHCQPNIDIYLRESPGAYGFFQSTLKIARNLLPEPPASPCLESYTPVCAGF